MTLELQTRICQHPKCSNTFRVLPKDPQRFCNKECEFRVTKDPKAIKQWHKNMTGPGQEQLARSLAKTASSGTAAPGDRPNQSRKERRARKFGTPSGEKKSTGSAERTTGTTRGPERDVSSDNENTIGPTRPGATVPVPRTPETTESASAPTTGSTMQATENASLTTSTEAGSVETRPSGSLDLSTHLREEKQGSIELLNSSAKHLLDLASSLTVPSKKGPDGEIVQRAPNQNVDVAIKALAELRNVMKCKLDYLKFGHELAKGDG